MPDAGDKLRAADVTFRPQITELPDGERPSSEGSWETWGDPITLDNPGIPVAVMAWGMASVTNDGDDAGVSMRVGISFDGGATWDDGFGPRDQTGGGAATRRGTVLGQHSSSTGDDPPSGEIQIRAQFHTTVLDSGGSHPTFYFGSLMALVVPSE